MKTLIIDPESETQSTVSFSFKLTFPDLDLIVAGNGAEGLNKMQFELPDLVIVETDLPDMDGFEVVKSIRLFSNVPLILVSKQRTSESDIAKGLEIGADDYISKPLRALDLMARSRAVIRRSGYYIDTASAPPFVSDQLTMDFATREVTVRGKPVHLTPTEYRLLFQLVRNAGKLVTIQSLKHTAWGDADFLEPSAVRKCISQLRRKLQDDPEAPKIILNERGMGYRIARKTSHHREIPDAVDHTEERLESDQKVDTSTNHPQ